MVDFEWYRSFVYIYKYNSVSQAAKTRIMTQPAMSQHLASLEAEVGEPLFIRTARKMIPTERGKELYSQLAPLIESLEETSLGFHAASLPTIPQIRIGSAIEYYTEKILPQLSGFEANTISSFGTADQLLLLLNEDKVDLIVTSQKSQTPGIEFLNLCTERFVIVAPAHLDPPQQMSLRSKEQWLLAQNWISYGLDLPIVRRLWREHFKKRPAIKPNHVIPNLHLIMQAVENGLGLSLIPDYMIHSSMNREQAKVILEDLHVHNQIYIAYKSNNKHLPAIRSITEKLLGTAVD
ncbi:Hca operon transcriptional activator [compost metagenome]